MRDGDYKNLGCVDDACSACGESNVDYHRHDIIVFEYLNITLKVCDYCLRGIKSGIEIMEDKGWI